MLVVVILKSMVICVAQTTPILKDLSKNLEQHMVYVEQAVEEYADCIVFSELSLTGYEPTLASKSAISNEVAEISELQVLCDKHKIIICVGAPVKYLDGITISMVIFRPHSKHYLYSKQHLHPDEKAYFVEGKEQSIINVKDTLITPAICFESMLEKHLETCIGFGSNLYVSSVAKHEKGIIRAYRYFSEAAKKYKIPIIMSNCVGLYNGMLCCGQSAVWDNSGELVRSLNKTETGLLVYNTTTNQAHKKNANKL